MLRDFETFALAEDFRLGPSFSASASHSEPALGSTVRFERLSGSVVYRWLFGDKEDNPARNGDVLSASVGYETRLQEGEFQDNETTVGLRNYTPVFWRGRLVTRALLIHRFRDGSNQQSTLGGGSGLRGYPTGAFLGRSLVRGNVEWRTLPLELYTFQLGMVGFYDVGGVSDASDLSGMTLYHGVGIGGRLVNPTTDRVVMRFDYAFPLTPPAGQSVLPGSFEFGFAQAF
ncbi:MAG: BamA/TamA family outer membrane protein [Myxococcota bacterium]